MMHGPFAPQMLDARQVHLRVLATSDLHMHLMPFDYARNRASVEVGLARTAGLIAAARAGARNAVLLDNGDFLQGSPMADLAAQHADTVNPAVAAMNALGYDAAALGNHEFNYGLPLLERAAAAAGFPVLAANAAVALGAAPRGDRPLVAPWAILRRQVTDLAGRQVELRLGVIGLVPPQVAVWDRDHVAGRVWFRDMVEAAAARVPELREAGADVVVALAHTGIGDAAWSAGMENAAVPLARVPGIDALVLGHAHLVFPSARFAGWHGVDAANGLVGGKPAVMPGAFGSHLGVMDLLLQPDGAGWRVAASSVTAQPIARRRGSGRLVARAPVAPVVLQVADAAHRCTRAWVARPLGRSGQRLSSHFALVADTAAFRLVAGAKAAFVRAALRGTGWDGVPVLGSASPFKTGGRAGVRAFTDIPPGMLTARHVSDLYPFPNGLRAVQVTGAGLRAWLETSAALYRQVAPGDADVPLFGPDAPGYTLNLIAGVAFEIRAGQPPGNRIGGLSYRGRAVADGDAFIVATSSYRAAISAPQAPVVLSDDMPVAQVLARHVAAGGASRIDMAGGWRLRLPTGARVTFDTAPAARAGAGGPEAQDLGLTPAGFRRFRLWEAEAQG